MKRGLIMAYHHNLSIFISFILVSNTLVFRKNGSSHSFGHLVGDLPVPFGREVAPNGSILQLSVDLQDMIGTMLDVAMKNPQWGCHFNGQNIETPLMSGGYI